MMLGISSTASNNLPTEDILVDDSFANEIYMKFVDESDDIGLVFDEMDHTEKLYLDELQSITDKIDLPINDFVASIGSVDDFNIDGIKSEQLLMEFNNIFNTVDLQNELTPPQTPPELYVPQYSNSNDIPTNGQYEIFNYHQPPSQQVEPFIVIPNASPVSSSAPSPGNEISILYEGSNHSMNEEIIFDPDSIISSPADIQRELEVVDELVRAHSSRNSSDYDDVSASSSQWSSSSPRSEYSSGYSQYDYETPNKSKSKSGLKGVSKKRSRGYGRNPEEKKSRKKEQNKNAATRYRQKKKQEVEVILDEEKILMDKNRRLATTYKDTKREVKYLKSLLRDLFKARGFI
jgi:cyclic AMP-dependent transcription factor ATF-4